VKTKGGRSEGGRRSIEDSRVDDTTLYTRDGASGCADFRPAATYRGRDRDGQIAYITTDRDLVLRSEADGSERRLANYRWGEVWYIADGHVVTGGPISSTARTPIEAIPLVSP
jgi:hypothetical protein